MYTLILNVTGLIKIMPLCEKNKKAINNLLISHTVLLRAKIHIKHIYININNSKMSGRPKIVCTDMTIKFKGTMYNNLLDTVNTICRMNH